MPQLNKLNTLIETSQNPRETFLENLELWTDFYNNRYSFIHKHLLDEKLYNIINFLLSNEQGEIFDYFHSNLIEDLYNKEGELCFELRNHTPKQEKDINTLFTLLNNHNQISQSLSSLNIEDSFGEFQKYQSDDLELEIVDALIISIHEQFFQIDPVLARITIEFISKSPTLFHDKAPKKLTMYNDLIFQYIDKLLPIKEFLGMNLNDDTLIKKVKTHEIKNKKIITKLFKTLSFDKIMTIFNDNLDEVITFLENTDVLNDVEKQVCFDKVADDLLKKNEFSYLFKLIIQSNQSNIWKNYLTNQVYSKIIMQARSEVPVGLDENMIQYILERNYETHEFLINLEHLTSEQNRSLPEQLKINRTKIKDQIDKRLKQKYYLSEDVATIQIQKEDSLEQKKLKSLYYEMSGRVIDFEVALELLDAYFQDKTLLVENHIYPIIRSIITYMLQSIGISLNGVYFYENNQSLGIYYHKAQIIAINKKQIKKFIDKNNPLFKRIQLFITSFHEMQHAIQYHKLAHNLWNIETYEMQKESILEDYDTEFYPTNYQKIKMEIDARIAGYDSLAKFLETYFPSLLDTIQDQLITELEKEQKFKKNQITIDEVKAFKNLQTICTHAFDTLAKYNPTIIEKHPIFNLEYYPNGTPKTIEEIELQKTPQNQELIDNIIKRRTQLTLHLQIEKTTSHKRN